MKNSVNYIIFILLLAMLPSLLSAQATRVRGRVTDAETGEPVAFASVVFDGIYVGTTTDMEGYYNMETREAPDSLRAMHLNYFEQAFVITPRAFNTVDFRLRPNVTVISAAVVTMDENPAHQILRNISDNKHRNDPDRRESYTYEAYTRMEVDIANMKPQFRNRRMQDNFGFVFEYMDTSVFTGKAYLPVMISESASEYYYRRSPRIDREVVTASRISGLEDDPNWSQFTGQMHEKVNVYDNFIRLFDVDFVGPVSEQGLLFYDYFLVDSTNMDGRKIYKIRFHPKGKATPVFDGEINVDSLTWALESASMRMIKGLNVNWVRDLYIENRNQLLDDSTWFYKTNAIVADFTVDRRDSSKLESFMVQRRVEYSNITLDGPIPEEIVSAKTNVITAGDVLKPDEEFWAGLRPYALSEREQGVFTMVEEVKDVPLFNTIYNTLNTLLFGYYGMKNVELGPYYKLMSFNKLEGVRFQLGARTTREFSERIRLSAYGAYSTKDSRFKGGGSVEYVFDKDRFTKLTLSASRDVRQLGASVNALTTGNILSSVFSKGRNEKMNLINDYYALFERQWTPGFGNSLRVGHTRLFPTDYVQFAYPSGEEMKRIEATEVTLGFRLSKDEIRITKPFEMLTMGSKFPLVNVYLTAGLKNVFGGDYEYYRAELSSRQTVNIPPLGQSTLLISGGKIFGDVPYPLLKLHEGNATYIYDIAAFSCMDFYEFASDLWGSVVLEHHFRGFFLGRIPLMKRLQWREVFTFKALWGELSDANNGSLPDTKAVLRFPEGMGRVGKPYMEIGCGVENIFKLFRFDAVWRLTHRDALPGGRKPENFAFNVSMRFEF